METFLKRKVGHDHRHGGPYDRGSADSYYGRSYDPHYYVADTMTSARVELADMTAQETIAYTAGWNDNEATGHKKEW